MNLGAVLHSRWRLAVNQFRHGSRQGAARVRRPLIVLALGLTASTLVAVALTLFFLSLVQVGVGPRESAAALGWILTGALAGLIAFDLHEAVSTLIADSDLELLRRAPVHPMLLFGLKLLDTVPRTSLLVLMLLLPSLVAYGVAHPGPAWSWLLLPPAVAALWLVPMGLGIAAALALLLVVPARVTREVLGLLSALVLLVLWLGQSFLLPRLADDATDLIGTLRALAETPPIALLWSPGWFVARMMGAAQAGDVVGALSFLGAAWLAAAVAFALAAWMSARALEAVRARVLAGDSGRRRARRPLPLPAPGLGPALFSRDTKLFLRGWTVLGDILTMSVMWTLLPLLGLPLWEMPKALVARSMMLALTVALGFEVGARAIPFERLGIAWMRLAPVHAWRWVFGRYVGILAIALPIVSIAAVAVIVGFRLGLDDALGMIAVALPALMVALALGLWTGAAFGNFAWSHPRAMLTVTGRLLATLMLLGQAVSWLMLGLTFDSLAIAPYLMLAAMVASIGLVAGFQALAGYTLARRLWS